MVAVFVRPRHYSTQSVILILDDVAGVVCGLNYLAEGVVFVFDRAEVGVDESHLAAVAVHVGTRQVVLVVQCLPQRTERPVGVLRSAATRVD